MRRGKPGYINFFKGFASYGAIMPLFFTSYPYHYEDKSVTLDWYCLGDDINSAINKYDENNERE